MPDVRWDRYYRYDDLTRILNEYAAEHPHLVEISSIGKSHEGRDIWLATVTDQATGPAADKPAYWCDGNIHATEVSASSAVLRILDELVNKHHELLKSRAFYLVPRLGPDGAEWALADEPRHIRSSTRPYPFDEEDPEGLERLDIDGDGRILSMRVPDPNGPWTASEEEPRLLRRRKPGENGGQYYRVMPEGLFHSYDGMTMRGRKVKQGLDMNRNWPSHWRIEQEQHGAGEFPTSEPEIRAAVAAITSRPNICGAATFHTFSGVLLRPSESEPDENLPAEDVWAFKEMGETGHKMTGYPAISVYHEFRYHPKEVITGVFDDWMYEHRGVYAWTVEIWSPQRQAGIQDYKFIDWFRDHPFEHDVMMLKWSDEKLDGLGYIDWQPFVHPQLGPVEIGGWDPAHAFRNPPPQFLEAEITPLAEWTIWLAGATPCLEHRDLVVERQGGVARIRWAVQNTGWLPTNVTELAKKKKLTRGVVAEIVREGDEETGAGSDAPGWLVSGKKRSLHGELSGWSHVTAGGFGWSMDSTTDVAVLEWVVEASGVYHLTARHERAGRLTRTVSFEG